jgi:4-diphosphocytidyl-2-C-methyl-D-erythritol kinase
VGEQLLPFADAAISGRAVLLVNPLITCPTGPVFRQWDGVDRGPLDFANWHDGRNDLEKPAISLHPEIAEVLRQLDMTKPDLARMSGSGATCFALYASVEARNDAQQAIAAACPQWWTMASSLR